MLSFPTNYMHYTLMCMMYYMASTVYSVLLDVDLCCHGQFLSKCVSHLDDGY